jgi:hypothetical protein
MPSKIVDYRHVMLLVTVFTVLVIARAVPLFGASPAVGGKVVYTIGAVSEVSSPCAGAEVPQPVDPKLGYVYEVWT